jgi:hypothetical protein
LHRGLKTTPIALGLVGSRDEWQWIDVDVPRCGRCRIGHHVEVLLFLVGLPALVWGMAMLLDTALGTYSALPLVPSTVPRIGVWFLPFIAWLALRHGWFGLRTWFPHNRRYVRRHPAVRHRLNSGWRYGRAPMRHWDRRWS